MTKWLNDMRTFHMLGEDFPTMILFISHSNSHTAPKSTTKECQKMKRIPTSKTAHKLKPNSFLTNCILFTPIKIALKPFGFGKDDTLSPIFPTNNITKESTLSTEMYFIMNLCAHALPFAFLSFYFVLGFNCFALMLNVDEMHEYSINFKLE